MVTDLIFKTITPFEGKAYVELLLLRQAVLRTPLHKTLTLEALEAEQEQHHVGLVDCRTHRLLGCYLLKCVEDSAQLRQMAVDTHYQGAGLGTRLLHHAETLTGQLGFNRLTLQARLEASPFYSRFGYKRTSGLYKHLDINHVDMEKWLT